MADEDGPRIEGYEPLELIDRGGASEVWLMRVVPRATDAGDDAAAAQVAVKIFDPHGAPAGRQEWQRLHGLAGPHVVPALDLTSTADGREALVMPWCSGGSLARIVEGRGGLTVAEMSSALAPMAQVLASLHEQGLVHGDVHPKNILFTADGRPLLADLGCARSVSDVTPSQGYVDGYTAAEVLDGAPAGPPADVHALGVVAWFALTGSPPGPAALRPRLRDLLDDADDELCDTVTAALALTPDARPTMSRFVEVLQRAGHAVPVPVPHPAHPTERAVRPVLTARRRSDAVHRERRRSATPTGRRTPVWRSLLVVTGVGVALVAGASWLPVPHHRTPKAGASPTTSGAASAPASSASPGGTRHTAPRASQSPMPDVADLRRVLACRAEAWNRGEVKALEACLAARSQALGDDARRLSDAAQRGLRYEGVAFEIQEVRQVLVERGTPTARARIARAPYRVRTREGVQTVPAHQDDVRLTLSGGPGRWRIATWNVV